MRYAVVTVVIVAALGLGGLGGYVLHGQGVMQGLGSGLTSCGTWLANRSTPSVTTFQGNWFNGYLTGYQDAGNILTARQVTDAAARSAWVDNYCQAWPLNDLTDAARGLYLALASREP